jgi:hypothetical protein
LITGEDEIKVKLNIGFHCSGFININFIDLTPNPFPKMEEELYLEYGESSALTILRWLPPPFPTPDETDC